MRRIVLYFFILLFVVLYSDLSVAQSNDEMAFNKAVEIFKQNDFAKALHSFTIFEFDFPKSDYVTASKIFIAKCYVATDKYTEAIDLLTEYQKRYPKSNYVNECKMVLADAYVQKKEYDKATDILLSIVESGLNSDYKEAAKSTLETLLVEKYSVQKIKELISIKKNSEAEPLLYLALGKKYFKEGDLQSGKKQFFYVVTNFYGTAEYDEADKLRSIESLPKIEVPVAEMPLVTVLLPLFEATDSTKASTGYQILEGIKFAFNNYNEQNPSNKIGLLIKDTKRDKEEIAQIREEFKKYPSAKLIIGPLFTDEAEYVCQAFADTNFLVFSPTATGEHLTRDFYNFFQANPSFEERGRNFANYVYNVELRRRVAVVACSEGYSAVLASSFAKEFIRLGGKITIEEYYGADVEDFEPYIKKLSGSEIVSDGIYMPISDESIATLILSALSLYPSETRIYANQDWLTPKVLHSSLDVANRFIIGTDTYVDYFETEYSKLKNDFEAKTGFVLDRTPLYGFDLANYLIEVFKTTGNNKQLIENKIKSDFEFSGYHNTVSFGKNRINSYENIVKIEAGTIRFVTRYKTKVK